MNPGVNTAPQSAANFSPVQPLVQAPRVAAPVAPATLVNVQAPQNNIAAPAEQVVRVRYDDKGNIIPVSAKAVAPQPVIANKVATMPVDDVQFARVAPAPAPAPVPQPVNLNTAPPAPMVNNIIAAPPITQAAAPKVVASSALSIAIPKYSDLEPSKQAVWDNKLEQWVKDGMSANSQTPAQKLIWNKQQAVFEKVYSEQFNGKVDSIKRRMGSVSVPQNMMQPDMQNAASMNGITVESRPVVLKAPAGSYNTSAMMQPSATMQTN